MVRCFGGEQSDPTQRLTCGSEGERKTAVDRVLSVEQVNHARRAYDVGSGGT